MTSSQIVYYLKTWLKHLFSRKAGSALLNSFGALWLTVEATTFFAESTEFPHQIRLYWWLFAVAGLVRAFWVCRPRLSICHKLNGRDVAIEIAIGDMFSFSGSLIIGSNTTFDTIVSRELISENSVQGTFTRKYYNENLQLDAALNLGLKDIVFEELPGSRIGKKKRYPIGTCVRLNPEQRTAYFVAIANINELGVASGSFEELKQALGQIWAFIGQRGTKDRLVIPVIGSGSTRLKEPRQVIVTEIIKSFVAACSEKSFCDKLTIVLRGDDVIKHKIELDAIGDYVRYICTFTEFSTNNSLSTGTPVGESSEIPLSDNRGQVAKNGNELLNSMSQLISEMKSDLAKSGAEFVREFFVLQNRRVLLGGSSKLRFVYYADEHQNLFGQLDVLEANGLVENVTPIGNSAPLYRMSEDLVHLLCEDKNEKV
jgi:hypothetical protein